ncbi:non-ribosomal peptide synthetase [Saccharothrix texasensis]|uniref:Amino acid adenylation domain-containing protein n=1 Tax=Saccharothrix texasensis TaxID=103734 RepID=A0A3N1GZU1_9PSEU|nr:non-ribosomal peptide synthetase [Saccharothrix texasensis]ROP35502.1 amino acid adenylation domain-containing protein [Saccharothrix texasensis]
MHTDSPSRVAPALPLQSGMIAAGLRDPSAGTDVIQCVQHWPHGLDTSAYLAAWRAAVDRHPVLRTRFAWRADGGMEQWPGPVDDVPVLVDDSATDLDAFLAADRRAGVDPVAASPLRVVALPGDVVVVTFHHAILDGRSLAMLLAEVDDDYAARLVGGSAEFAPRPDFADYARWHDARIAPEHPRRRADERFWAAELAGSAEPGPLPLEHAGPGTPVMATAALDLSDAETGAVRALAERAGVTVNTAVLAAWGLVLTAHARADEAVFGVTRAARHGTVEGAEDMLGLLLATVPLRLPVDRDASVADWLRSVRARSVRARDHQLCPLPVIRRAAGHDASSTRSLVLFERRELGAVLAARPSAPPGRRVRILRTPGYAMTLYAFAEPRLSFQLIHDTGRFPDWAAGAVLAQVRDLLAGMAEAPDRPVRHLGEPRDHTRAPAAWNDTGVDYPADATVPDLFAEQVRLRPDADAVFDGERWLSYARLDERSNRLAHVLLARGARADLPVALSLPRGADFVTAMLAVLKTGAAYLPLDPANPAARDAVALRESGTPLVVSDRPRALPDGVTSIVLPELDLSEQSPVSPGIPAHPLGVAYVNYTSGSTGKPKGVAVPHRGVVRLVTRPTFARFGPGRTFLHLSATAFDLTTLEVWGALLTGGRVVPAPAGPPDPAVLADLLRVHRVSVLWLTAGLFHQLDPSLLADVEQLLAGGDVLAPDAVRAALAVRGGKPVVNGYGPTENTTFTTCHVLRSADDVGATVPIGTPIQRTTAHVLDESMRPVPVGVPGELYTGGDGLARGYLGAPGATAAKFVPDPFGDAPGGRLYRTGDLARWRPDGVLEFLGRVDRQVKVRGFLVEPAEVEAVLREHPAVAEAAVLPIGDDDARHLVAFIVPTGPMRTSDNTATSAVEDVRTHVAERLPAYLCPARYVPLPELPLNRSGKVDRAALRSVRAPGARGTDRTRPSTATQRRLAELWENLLGTPDVCAEDDFFAVGGNSLLAVRLAFRVREEFGVEVPVADLHRARTLAGCAAVLDAAAGSPTSRAPITRRDRSAYLVPARRASAPPVADHLVLPTGGDWAAWRWVELRGTGFGIEPLLAVASPDAARAADAVTAAEEAVGAARWAAARVLREVEDRARGERRSALRRIGRLVRKGRFAEARAALAATPATVTSPIEDALVAAGAAPEAGGGPATVLVVGPDPAADAGQPTAASDDERVDAALAEAEEAATRHEALLAEYAARFDAGRRATAEVLRVVSGDARFREAVAWQNPRALQTAVDALHRALSGDRPASRNVDYRRWEHTVVSYLQRYSAKNDTIGFFGPVGWARVEDDAPAAITARPGPDLIDSRTTYLENWAVQQVAEALTTDAVRPWAVPRRMPFVDVVGDTMHVPLTDPVRLPAADAAVLAACDGLRRAAEIASGLGRPVDDVLATLERLRQAKRIAWTLEVPPEALVPETALREQITAIGDPEVRAVAERALHRVERGRDAVAAAVGDPDRLVRAIDELHETFTAITGTAAVRRPGLFYAGRTVVHEECRRDLDVTLSPALVETLWTPLSLVLEAARWFTSAGAALYGRALREVYRERVAATGSDRVPLADFWLWANDTIFRLDERLIGRLVRTLQDRWAKALGQAPGGREAHYRVRDVRDAVLKAFAAPRPGWRGAVQHSPDVLIAARDEDAIRAGDYRWVLGEVHPGVNTVRSALFVSQHPDPAQLRAAMRHDMAGPRIVLATTREEGGTPQRLADALVSPDDLKIVFGHDACGPGLRGAVPVGACEVTESGGRLVARSRDGRVDVDLVELLNEQVMAQLVQHFRLLPAGGRTPRVSLDRLVVAREGWRLPAARSAFAFAQDEATRYLRAQSWRREHGMPRFVFVKSPVEHKPFYVDLESQPSVELFARAVRALDREKPDAPMGVGEMLPGPDQLWLTDAAGARHTAEFRVVAVDRRGWPEGVGLRGEGPR